MISVVSNCRPSQTGPFSALLMALGLGQILWKEQEQVRKEILLTAPLLFELCELVLMLPTFSSKKQFCGSVTTHDNRRLES
jgi:hypothetical protein